MSRCLGMWTFEEILKPTIWGGKRIAAFKGISCDLESVGESWEISDVPGSVSVVASGPDKGFLLSELIEKYGEVLTGKANYRKFGNRFPLLIKLLDAQSDLSVQVHPDDELARRRGLNSGKSELWFILPSSDDARIALGFKEHVDPAEYNNLVANSLFQDKIRYIPVKENEIYNIPGGRVHALGAGAMVAEIQETSDVTYRLYDYDRRDANGNKRELHTELAFEAIDFDDTEAEAIDYKIAEGNQRVISTPCFTVDVIDIHAPHTIDYSDRDSFTIIMALEGEALIESLSDDEPCLSSIQLKAGHTLLLPASCRGIRLTPSERFKAIDTFV